MHRVQSGPISVLMSSRVSTRGWRLGVCGRSRTRHDKLNRSDSRPLSPGRIAADTGDTQLAIEPKVFDEIPRHQPETRDAASRRSTASRIRPATSALPCSGTGSTSIGGHNRYRVGVHFEAGIASGHVIGHDDICALRLKLCPGVRDDILGLGCETDKQRLSTLPRLELSEVRENVARAIERERQGAVALLQLLRGRLGGRVVGNGGRHHHHIHMARTPHHGRVHVRSAAHSHQLSRGGRCQVGWPADQGHDRSSFERFGGHRVSHAAARAIADESHGIDVFVGGTRGDEHPKSSQPRSARSQQTLDRCDHIFRLGQPALPDPTARQIAGAGIDDMDAAPRQRFQVSRDRGVFEHVRVHRRSDHHRRPGSQIQRRQEVVGKTVGELPHRVGSRRRHEQEIDVRRQRNVFDIGVSARLPLVGDDGAARDRLEREWADETAGRSRHHRHHLVAVLLQAAGNFDRLVGADPAGHAECDESHGRLPQALKVRIILSAIFCIRCVRERSAAMISCNRTTVDSSWSLITT